MFKEPAVILSACRTPIGSFGGSVKDVSAADLGAIVIREAIARAGVDPTSIGDVIMGCVLQAGAGIELNERLPRRRLQWLESWLSMRRQSIREAEPWRSATRLAPMAHGF